MAARGWRSRLRARLTGGLATLHRRFGFGTRRGVANSTVAVALLCALVSVLRGQDTNWDLRNYHLYNAWSLLHGRLGLDLAPAQLQSYFTPMLDVPYFLLVQHAPAPLAGALLGLLHGLAFLPVAWIAWRALPGDPRRDWLAPLLGLAGLTSAAFLSELGNTMGDNSTAPLVLGALALMLPQAGGGWRSRQVVLAGALLGMAVAFKLTNAIYAVALGLAVLVPPLPWRRRLLAGAGLALVALVLFGVLAGPWLYRVWEMYGNPLFPQFNHWFQAPLAAPDAVADLRWRPKGLGETLLWPLLFTFDPHLVSEIAMLQAVWALLYVAALVAAIAWLWRRGRGAGPGRAGDPAVLRMLGVFFVAGFVLWLLMFSIHRYLVVLELLAPLVLWLLLCGTVRGRAGDRLAAIAVAFCALVALAGWSDWGHARWNSTAVRVETPPAPVPGVVLLVGDEPQSWRIPWLAPESVYVGVASNFPESPVYALRVREMLAGGDRAMAMLPADADGWNEKMREKRERIEKHNRWAARIGLDRGDCIALRWIAGRSRSRDLVEPADSPSGRCRLALAGTAGDVETGNRFALEDRRREERERMEQLAMALEQRYGLRVDLDACSVHGSWIGKESFPYRMCPVALLEPAGG